MRLTSAQVHCAYKTLVFKRHMMYIDFSFNCCWSICVLYVHSFLIIADVNKLLTLPFNSLGPFFWVSLRHGKPAPTFTPHADNGVHAYGHLRHVIICPGRIDLPVHDVFHKAHTRWVFTMSILLTRLVKHGQRNPPNDISSHVFMNRYVVD